MSRKQTIRWTIVTALFVFACSPVLTPSLIPTLGPDALNTAIAETARAAAGATQGGEQILQPVSPLPQGGPTLDPISLNTAIAGTAAAAATRTAALIPPTLTPSVTPLPSKTPSITPSPTQTFVFLLPTRTNTPRPPATHTPSGGGGGGGTGGGGDGKASYSCKFISVSPAAGTQFSRRERFQVVWKVRNTGDDWLRTSADLVYVSGNPFSAVDRVDFTSTVSYGDTVNLPAVSMRAPDSPGNYSATWRIQIGHVDFCSLPVSITVK
jgi:hypothetical protein